MSWNNDFRGAHLNPAVSLAYATVGKLRLKELPIYMLAQYLGAFLGAVLVYFVYKDAIYAVGKPGVWENSGEVTAMVFACYPFNEVSSGRCFVDQVVSTALLLLAVAAISDKKNMAVPRPAQPFAISLCLVGIIYGFLMNSGAPLNPARDLSPRIFTAMAGWGKEVFSYRDYNWFWVPIIGPHLGAVIGIWIYKIAIEIQWPTETRIEEDLQMENPFERQEST
ncbi:aquaporin-9-like isoform X2 [Limulus polyphemus]|uniref:Aquaporin-9-like isoform X2 n=1 Tax=Limulus polyphemus TaxID=6850 RepID=A0ABM1S4Y6_LIMPO|nr:aquaporin-9-like isoform X2 [Limulus polyphemus]